MIIDAAVVEALQRSLSAHYLAIQFYALLAACHDRRGFAKLAEHWRGESADECTHRDRILRRLEFLDVDPIRAQPEIPPVDDDPVLALRAAFAVEESVAQVERAGVLAARLAGDEGSALVLAENLEASEDSIYELRSWLDAIDRVTPANWLANWT